MFSVIHSNTRICFKGAFSSKITNPDGEGPVQIDKQRIVAKGEGIGFTFPKHTLPHSNSGSGTDECRFI